MSGLVTAFHDAGLIDFSVGPRCEVRLRLWVDGSHEVIFRLGAIQNIEAVRTYFDRLVRPPFEGAFLDRIEFFKPTNGGWLVELDRGGQVRIETSKKPDIFPASRKR